ncbi:hypothetical protein BT93_L5094 [Corymbia citriodora subsp. variegata]|uniref:F-box domain-containing protein n=1 Tax=Corymbia citriodora subsp. variegata TaxID=360336 RepID=A0A8T0CVA1_CORYI|nr:hypothetical protein BT93_L5094 [Corymbia citriodora subsp. variegata]
MAETSVHGAVQRKSSSGDRPPPPSSPRDLISALPHDVIHHIFLFLPLEDLVMTSVLSERWRFTWTATTDLVFNGEIEFRPGSTLDFPSLVDSVLTQCTSVLTQCTSPAVKRFHVTGFNYDDAANPKVDLWLRFVAQHHVEDLCLRVQSMRHFYKLPVFLCCSSWLVRLEVRLCYFSLNVALWWPCLKASLIEFAELSDDLLRSVLRGSPVLESLELYHSEGVEKIRAPHLLSLRVSRRLNGNHVLRLDDVSSSVEADLNLDILTGDRRMCCDLLKELLGKLRRVPIISIHGWCLEVQDMFNNFTIYKTCLC